MKAWVGVALLLALCWGLVATLAACGSGDPYVGTWRHEPTADGAFVIRLESGKYRGYVVTDQHPETAAPLALAKGNGELRAVGAGSNGGDVVIRLASQTDHLLLTDDGARPLELVKVSSSTSVPSGRPSATNYPGTQD
jgi:hypothetical protein